MHRGYQNLDQFGWWTITLLGIALLFTSSGLNLFGDGLKDALDVTTRERAFKSSLSTNFRINNSTCARIVELCGGRDFTS